MKILHTADWHLGNVFHKHARTEEHAHFLAWLLVALRAQKPDVLIVSGDIFDSANPAAAAERMFYDFLIDAAEAVSGMQIVIIAGNHDSAARLEAPAALLKRHNIYVCGTVKRTEEGEVDFSQFILPLSTRTDSEACLVCLALPYLRAADYPAGMSAEEGLRHYFANTQKELRKSAFRSLPLIAAAHFYAAGAEICESEHSERLVVGGQDCVSSNVTGENVLYVALGHIHKAQQVKGNAAMWYAGSALPMSFSEKGYEHGVQLVEIGDGAPEVSRLAYAPLRRLRSIPERGAGTAEDVLRAIEALPRRTAEDDGRAWDYLEIKVDEEEPSPELLHEVTRRLETRAVHFCRMVRVLSERKQTERKYESIEKLRSISPIEMAENIYAEKHGTAMPPHLKLRFGQAETAVYESMSDEQGSSAQ